MYLAQNVLVKCGVAGILGHIGLLFTRDSICYSAYMLSAVRLCLSICHTSRSYNGWT